MRLTGCTRPIVSTVVRQAAKFSNEPKACHDVAVKRIRKCLLGTSEEGLIHEPDSIKGMEMCADIDFAGHFEKNNAEDPESVCSRTGNVLKHASYPIFWKSKLEIGIALSTTYAENIALSTSSRETIPMMHLLREISAAMKIKECIKKMKCTVLKIITDRCK